MNKEKIIETIENATIALIAEGIDNIKLYIGGSSALSLPSKDFRGTKDIDLVKMIAADNEIVRSIINKFNINDDVMTSIDPNMIENYGYPEQICFDKPIYEMKNIKWYSVYPEVVLVSKIITGTREKDKSDLSKKDIKNILVEERMWLVLDNVFKRRKEDHGPNAIDSDESWIRREALKLLE